MTDHAKIADKWAKRLNINALTQLAVSIVLLTIVIYRMLTP